MTNSDLIRQLQNRGVLRTPEIIAAFKAVDRGDFIPVDLKSEAYDDHPLPLGFGSTISQPWTVAFMFELLEPKTGNRILDVGSGSGWTTAILSSIVGGAGRVVGIERIPELVLRGRENLAKYAIQNAEIKNAGEDLGFPSAGPYERILVSAAADNLPESLVGQLKEDGILVIPIRSQIWRVQKHPDGLDIKKYDGFAFVPLIER